jgi:hypothetical protein
MGRRWVMLERAMVSPSRSYVAICKKAHFDGYCFRRFVLPEHESCYGFNGSLIERARGYENNADQAAWYFLNKLNFSSCLETCCPLEDFGDAGELLERERTPAERRSAWRSVDFQARADEAEGPVRPW